MNREDKWNYITKEVLKSIDKIETTDIDTKIMKLNIMSNVYKMLETEEIFNDVLDVLQQNEKRILVKRRK